MLQPLTFLARRGARFILLVFGTAILAVAPAPHAGAQDKGSDIGMDEIVKSSDPLAAYKGLKTRPRNSAKPAKPKTAPKSASSLGKTCKTAKRIGKTKASLVSKVVWKDDELKTLNDLEWGPPGYAFYGSYLRLARKKVSAWLEHLRNPLVSAADKRLILNDLIARISQPFNPYTSLRAGPTGALWQRALNERLDPKLGEMDATIDKMRKLIALDEKIKSDKTVLEYREHSPDGQKTAKLNETIEKKTKERNRLYDDIPRSFRGALPNTNNRTL